VQTVEKDEGQPAASDIAGPSEAGNKVAKARLTIDQNLDLQRDALKGAGCERIFEDTVSGAKVDRTGLAALMTVLRAGDTVVIWRLNRLGRSLKNLIHQVASVRR
jgi:DNA invertase Pin-like site-specific DNA recombinase